MSECWICGEPTSRPIAAAVEHFEVMDLEKLRYVRGNIVAFGWVSGLRGSLTLVFPFLNTILNWKYRKWRLIIPEDANVCVREGK